MGWHLGCQLARILPSAGLRQFSSTWCHKLLLVGQQRHFRRAVYQRQLQSRALACAMVRSRGWWRLLGPFRLGAGTAAVSRRKSSCKLWEQLGKRGHWYFTVVATGGGQISGLSLQQRAGQVPARLHQRIRLTATWFSRAAQPGFRLHHYQCLYVAAQHPGILLSTIDYADYIAATGVPRRCCRQKILQTFVFFRRTRQLWQQGPFSTAIECHRR